MRCKPGIRSSQDFNPAGRTPSPKNIFHPRYPLLFFTCTMHEHLLMINSELLEKLAAGIAIAKITGNLQLRLRPSPTPVSSRCSPIRSPHFATTGRHRTRHHRPKDRQPHPGTRTTATKAKVISLAKWLTGAAAAAAIAAIVWITWAPNNKAPHDQLITNHPANDRLPATEAQRSPWLMAAPYCLTRSPMAISPRKEVYKYLNRADRSFTAHSPPTTTITLPSHTTPWPPHAVVSSSSYCPMAPKYGSMQPLPFVIQQPSTATKGEYL